MLRLRTYEERSMRYITIFDLYHLRYTLTISTCCWCVKAEQAGQQQKAIYEDVVQERDILGTQLIRRNDELALLYEKIRIQQSTLNKGEIQYRQRLEEIKALKRSCANLKRQLQIRSHEVTNIDALKNEVYHVQRELLQVTLYPLR
jgi:hypothetical protein